MTVGERAMILDKIFGFGVHSAREIPVPIPNTEVKPGSGDYTARAGN